MSENIHVLDAGIEPRTQDLTYNKITQDHTNNKFTHPCLDINDVIV